MRFVNLSATSEKVGKGHRRRLILRKDAAGQSAALPVLAFGDADTGFFQSSDDVLELTTAGVSRMKWDASGITTVSGNLVVSGTTTTIGSTTLTVDDKNIELGSVVTPSDTTADGGGITLKGATDKTFNWVNSTDAWTSSEHINLASGKTFQLNGTAITSSAAELNYTSGVTSAIQTQINSATLTSGIADTNNVIVNSASVADDEYARFTASGLESRSTSEVLSDIGAVGSGSPTFTGTVTAADIDLSGALSGSFLQETTTTISGTISEQKLVMADSTTLSGNLTVNDRLVLTQMQDDKYGLDAHVKLLIHSDTTDTSTTFTDSSRLGTHTITAVGGAQHKTAQYKFGATSMYFDGSGDSLTVPAHADWNFGSGNATIECWVFPQDATKTQRLLSSQGGSYLWILWWGRENNKFTFKSTNVAETDTSSTFSINTWYHVAVVKTGTNIKLYVNGILELEVTASGNFADTSATLVVGDYSGGGEVFVGYMDEIRISHLARWTENFTVPYKAYQDSTPALLTGGGYTITGSGTIENGLIDSTDQWEGSTYINTLGTVLEGKLTSGVTGSVAGVTTFPAGHILQVVSSANNTSVVNTTEAHDVDLMSVNITPKYSTSKIFILLDVYHGGSNPNGGWTLLRNSTAIGAAASQYGSSSGSFLTFDDVPGTSIYTMHHFSFNYLDSPNLDSAITYKLKASSTTTTYFNISSSGSHGYATSTITAMEIAG